MGSRPIVEGPDFLCIGMAKAGTGWLFDQVNAHPDFWMPPIKGLNYLGRPFKTMSNVTRRLERLGRTPNNKRQKFRDSNDRDAEFLQEAAALANKDQDLPAYAALFRHKGDLLSGDVTPTYADLSATDIAGIATVMPEVKIVLLVRDPVSRAQSRLSMGYRNGELDDSVAADPVVFRRYIETAPSLAEERSKPTEIVARWTRCAPDLSFRTILFDDIAERPDKARRELLTFLGADPEKQSAIDAGWNHKAEAAKLILNDAAKAILVDHFRDEIIACARLFGGEAEKWVTKYGLDRAAESPGAANAADTRVQDLAMG
jgi:hypothetical protein